MAYIPGCGHDIFLSYAHGDDRSWIERFVQRLTEELDDKVGAPVSIYFDGDDKALQRHVDYRKDIPEDLTSAGIFLFLPSPTYLRSDYCVKVECKQFEDSLPVRRARFSHGDLKNSLFAFRCPILPIPGNDHYVLLDGLSDIPFCDARDRFAVGSPGFEQQFRELCGSIVALLNLMRNDTTPVFVHKGRPHEDVAAAHLALTKELRDKGYRVLPEKQVKVREQFLSSVLSVFLLGRQFDDEADELAALGKEQGRNSVIWESAGAQQRPDVEQRSFIDDLRKRDTRTWTELVGNETKLKEEVLALLKPDPIAAARTGKPRVYVIYDIRSATEESRAGRIGRFFRREFQFDYATNRALHTRRLSSSDLVLLLWGTDDEKWCADEFLEIELAAGKNVLKTICVFGAEKKKNVIDRLQSDRGLANVRIAALGDEFDQEAIAPVFEPIRRNGPGA